MKLTVVASVTIVFLIPIATTLAAIAFLAPSPAAAQTSAYAQSDCVRQTMYDPFGNIRPGMTADAAAFACRSTKFNTEASECVQQTLYDSFGNIRLGMTAEAAAFACSDNNDFPIPVIILKP